MSEIVQTRRDTISSLASDISNNESLKTKFIGCLLLLEQFKHFRNLQVFSKLLLFTHLHQRIEIKLFQKIVPVNLPLLFLQLYHLCDSRLHLDLSLDDRQPLFLINLVNVHRFLQTKTPVRERSC